MGYAHIVFDIDGTLLDTEDTMLRSLSRAVEELQGRKMEVEELRFAFGITSEDAVKQLGITNLQTAVKLWDTYIPDYWHLVHVFDGILECLEGLKNQGARTGIITSKTREEYEREFVPFGLSGYFDTVICADDSPRHKPYADPMEAYLKKSKADRANVVYIGDSRYDMACAEAAGTACALALWGCHHPEEIRADYYLDSPAKITALLYDSDSPFRL